MADSKTVVLSAIDNSNKKAVLNLERDDENCVGSIRLYNFKESLSGILSLGFLIDNQVFKAALVEKSRDFYAFQFKISEDINKFSCALIQIQGGDAKPLLLGSSDELVPKDLSYRLAKNFGLLDSKNLSVGEVEKSLNESRINYNEEEVQEIEKILNNEFSGCSNCQYRHTFYSESETTPSFQRESQQKIFNSNENFYEELKNQLDILFDKYPEETFLTEVIPNSKWVKVDYEDDGNYIVIGLIYEKDSVQYVCYGAPGEFAATPPKEFNGLSQWLPLDIDKPEELGYWIIYQDAETGENVEVKVS